MITWICENIASIIVCVAIFAIVALIIVNMIKNRRQGKSSCGCGCQNCSMNGMCHDKK